MPSITVPVVTEGKTIRVRVWSDTCQGYDQGNAVAEWLCKFLGEVRRGARGLISNIGHACTYPNHLIPIMLILGGPAAGPDR